MKIKKVIQTEEEVEIKLPAFRKDGHNIFKIINEKLCVTVWLLDYEGNKLFSLSTSRSPEDVVNFKEATEEEFETALNEAISLAHALSQTMHYKSGEKISEVETAFNPHDL